MANKKLRPSYALIAVSALLAVLGFCFGRFILLTIPEKTRIDNVILTAIPFICYFVAILLIYIFLINLFSQILNHNIAPRVYKPVNFLIIAGIIGGIVMMLQPFTIVLYKMSFMVVLVCLLLFILWSHVIPATIPEEEEE
jgi:hypothetical protein